MISKLTLNTSLCTFHNENKPCTRGYVLQNIIIFILPTHIENVSIGSMVLMTKHSADNEIVIDDGDLDRATEIARKVGTEIIVHRTNKGKIGTLKASFAVA